MKAYEFTELNENIKFQLLEDDTIIIEIKLSRPGKLSASEKSFTHATTHGNKKLKGTELVLGLNVYSQNKSKE